MTWFDRIEDDSMKMEEGREERERVGKGAVHFRPFYRHPGRSTDKNLKTPHFLWRPRCETDKRPGDKDNHDGKRIMNRRLKEI